MCFFFQVTRLAEEAEVPFLLLEKVFGLLGDKMMPTLQQALSKLLSIGYQVQYVMLRASEVDAPHARARVSLDRLLKPLPSLTGFSQPATQEKNRSVM